MRNALRITLLVGCAVSQFGCQWLEDRRMKQMTDEYRGELEAFSPDDKPQPIAKPYMLASGPLLTYNNEGEPMPAKPNYNPPQAQMAIPVIGHPGMYTSPGDIRERWINAEGIAPGSLIRDPYSGMLLLIPQP